MFGSLFVRILKNRKVQNFIFSEKMFKISIVNILERIKRSEILIAFLLSSIYIRRKYWIRENFRLPVFDGFTCFKMS